MLLYRPLSLALSLSFPDASFLDKSSTRFAFRMKYTIYMLINEQRSPGDKMTWDKVIGGQNDRRTK
jgi:hypothetical protein